jgi:hypothetical protein
MAVDKAAVASGSVGTRAPHATTHSDVAATVKSGTCRRVMCISLRIASSHEALVRDLVVERTVGSSIGTI